MAVLVIAEHDNASLKGSTLNIVAAAAQCGGDIHVLVAGHNCGAVAEAASKLAGAAKVLVSDAAQFADGLAEDVSEQMLALASGYSHILAPATACERCPARGRQARRRPDSGNRQARD